MKYYKILTKLGLPIDKTKADKDGWLTIKAPHRNDTKATFSINIKNGGWKDHHTKESGDLVNLIQLLFSGWEYSEAEAYLEGMNARLSMDSETNERFMKSNQFKYFKELLNTKPPLSNDALELKISKLESIISALNDFVFTSKLQEEEINKILSSLKVLLHGTLIDATNAGHSKDGVVVIRIFKSIMTVNNPDIKLSD